MRSFDSFGLTLAQRDIYLDQLRQPASPLYNVGGYIRFGAVDAERLRHAHGELVRNEEVFGVRLGGDDLDAIQHVSEVRDAALPLHDFSGAADPRGQAEEWLRGLFETALPLENAALFRAALLKIADDEYWYAGMAHHLIMDGWGFANWARRLGEYYGGTAAAPAPCWRALVDADRAYLDGRRSGADRGYWRACLADLPDPLLTPAHGAAAGGSSARSILTLSAAQSSAVEAMAGRLGASIPQVLVSVLALYLHSAYERSDFLIGLPVHNRNTYQHKQRLGVFASVSPLRVRLAPAMRFRELVAALAAQQQRNLRHQRYPLGDMMRDLGLQGGGRRLYDIGFSYLKLDSDLVLGGAAAELVYLSHRHEATPLMMTVWEYGAGRPVQVQLDHNLAYFSTAEMTLVCARLQHLFDALPQMDDMALGEIGLLPPAELARLQQLGTAVPAPGHPACLHELFVAQARATPHAIAVRCGAQALSYAELDAHSDRVAAGLRAHGAGPETLVGLCVERSARMVAALFGILKTGAAYVPLDPAYPPERQAYMLRDSGAALLLSQAGLCDQLAQDGVRVILLDALDALDAPGGLSVAAPAAGPDNLAYVIYTSGSTGRPKGVAVTHRSAAALVGWAQRNFSAPALRAVLASTSLNFDLSVFELFVPLSLGHTCVVVRDALALLEQPCDVSLLNTVPSAMKILLEQGAIPQPVQVINLAGEALSRQLVNALFAARPEVRIHNLYGPSEDTTYSTCEALTAPVDGAPLIGRAIDGTTLYVLGTSGRLAPLGAPGELYIGGLGLARGYVNQAALTAERFVPDPFSGRPGARLYRTGDIVRWIADGRLAFVGRADEQVKIRGHRIELGEIEARLSSHGAVKEAVCVARQFGAGDTRLVAYVVPQSASQLQERELVAQLRTALTAELPAHMVPAAIVVLAAVPLHPNGKINRNALPAPALDQHALQTAYLAPATATETAMVALWASLLQVEAAGIGSAANFFALGGHSLLLMRLLGEFESRFGVKVSLSEAFEAQSLGRLAQLVDQKRQARLHLEAVISEERKAYTLDL
jgi:amino acid adenylation domain-containing protein